MKIKPIDPQQAEQLIDELDAYQRTLYPPDSCHLDSIETLQDEDVLFLGAIHDGEIIAIGSVKICGDYGELKRIYVSTAHRRKGLAQKIISELEAYAISRHILIVRLETGPHSTDAIKLYERLGYVICEKFGDYKEDALSTFMEKHLE